MKSKCSLIVILVVIILLLHIAGIIFNLYEKKVRIDIPQHILSGAIFGLIWFWLLESNAQNFSKSLTGISIVSFAVLGSLIWEFFEFALWNFAPILAKNIQLYSPRVGELLGDMLSGLTGGIAIVLYTMYKKAVKV